MLYLSCQYCRSFLLSLLKTTKKFCLCYFEMLSYSPFYSMKIRYKALENLRVQQEPHSTKTISKPVLLLSTMLSTLHASRQIRYFLLFAVRVLSTNTRQNYFQHVEKVAQLQFLVIVCFHQAQNSPDNLHEAYSTTCRTFNGMITVHLC